MKFSKRNVLCRATRGATFGAILGAVIAGSGCQLARNIEPDVLDDTPIIVDPAMARRDWEPTSATYAATGIYATPNLYTFQSQPYGFGHSTALTELPLFMANVIIMPYQVFAEPVWREKEYRAATTPPTYSAMPPLPPSNENELEVPPAPESPDEQAVPMDQPATMPSNG